MKYCIIGGSAAGLSACEAIRKIDKKGDITLITDEKFPLYSRCLLSYLLVGSIGEEKLKFKDEDFFTKNKINALLGVRVEKIDSRNKEVTLSTNKKVAFDRLLIATGARAKNIGIPGEDKKGVFTLRTIEDARSILSRLAKDVRKVAILGGGLIGMRGAYAMAYRGLEVKVIVKSEQILSQMMGKEGANIIERHIKKFNIEVMKGVEATEVLGRDEVEGLSLDNGSKLDCELVVIGKGVLPNIELAKEEGINTDWGIVVDEYLTTSQKDIYAAGDVAQTKDSITGESTVNALWPCAVEQGIVAGANIAGRAIKYEGSQSMNSLDLFGLSTISIGVTKPRGEGWEVLVSETNNTYKRLVLKNDILYGVTLIGRVENAGVYGLLMRNKVNLRDYKGELLKDNFSYAKILPLIKKEPEKFCRDEFQDIILTYEETPINY